MKISTEQDQYALPDCLQCLQFYTRFISTILMHNMIR